MKVGELYKVSRSWGSIQMPSRRFWYEAGPILYLGEDVIKRNDGVKIINHAVLVKGQRRILDQSFLKFLKPLTSS